jgi:hypothetical protein
VGVLLAAAFPVPERQVEESIKETWNVYPPTLEPGSEDALFGCYMRFGDWFELDVSSSDQVRLVISVSESAAILIPIFQNVGTRFTQIVPVDDRGTFTVQIFNDGSSSVSLQGKVVAWEVLTNVRTVYPYASVGTLVAGGGIIVLIFAFLKKSKKLPRKKTL